MKDKKPMLDDNRNGVVRSYRDVAPSHLILETEINSLQNAQEEKYESDDFEAGGYKWRLILYPNGNKQRNGEGYISLYLAISETEELGLGWEVNVNFKFFVLDQTRDKYLTIQNIDGLSRFRWNKTEWGFDQLISHDTLTDGYLVDNNCVFGAEVFVITSSQKFQSLSIKNIYTWTIAKFSKLKQVIYSECFTFGKIKCGKGKSLSVYLSLFDSKSQRKEIVEYKLRILDQIHNNHQEKDGIVRSYRDVAPSHLIFKIEIYSLQNPQAEKYKSATFEAGGYNWRLILYPNGDKKRNGKGYVSLYLAISETEKFPIGWEVNVNFKLFVLDQIRDKYLTFQNVDGLSRFRWNKTEWGFDQCISHDALTDASNGYLVDHTCVFGAEVFVITTTQKFEYLPLNKIYTWKIANFSELKEEIYRSEVFIIGEIKWQLICYPKGNSRGKGKAVSIYLELFDWKRIPCTQKVEVAYWLRIRDQIHNNHREYAIQNSFSTSTSTRDRGFHEFLSLSKLNTTSMGFIENDTLIIEVEFVGLHVVTDPSRTCDDEFSKDFHCVHK